MPISKALRFVQGPVSSRARSMAQEEFGAPDNVRFTFGGMVDSSWIAISVRQTYFTVAKSERKSPSEVPVT